MGVFGKSVSGARPPLRPRLGGRKKSARLRVGVSVVLEDDGCCVVLSLVTFRLCRGGRKRSRIVCVAEPGFDLKREGGVSGNAVGARRVVCREEDERGEERSGCVRAA